MEGYLDRALSELSRVGYLLRTLKTYNMYERPHLQTLELKRFLEQFLSVVGEDFRERGIDLNVSVEPDAEACQADPRALQQVLLNFLTNAADALQGRQGPVIAIRVLRRTAWSGIQVEDNGCGMTEEEQRALFKPFYTTKAKGTGLGLVIVKKMLTMMNGTIRIVSRKDSGTIVNVELPDGVLLRAAERTEGTRSACMKKKNQPRTILIVDDEAENRRIYAEILNDLGYRTIEKPDGESALARHRWRGRRGPGDRRLPDAGNERPSVHRIPEEQHALGADDHGDRLRERGKLSAVLQPGRVRIHEQALFESGVHRIVKAALKGGREG